MIDISVVSGGLAVDISGFSAAFMEKVFQDHNY